MILSIKTDCIRNGHQTQNRAIMEDWLKNKEFLTSSVQERFFSGRARYDILMKEYEDNHFYFGIMHTDESYRLMSGMCIKRKENRVIFYKMLKGHI